MPFDRASANYAEFGPFYTGMVAHRRCSPASASPAATSDG
jgi:hypothetical protein